MSQALYTFILNVNLVHRNGYTVVDTALQPSPMQLTTTYITSRAGYREAYILIT